MKKIISGTVVGLAAGGLVTWNVMRPHPPGGEPEHKEESRAQRGTNGEMVLKLDRDAQERAGLQVEPLAAARLSPEVKGYGRVLDPAPLAALVAEFLPAHVAAQASQQEFERTKTLHAQNNASTRALQLAEAAARRDQLLLESVRTRFVLSWGRAVAEQNDLPSFVRSLTTLENTLVRIDLPAGEALKSAPTGARLVLISAEESPMEAQFLGPAPSVDPQTQGQGFLFLVKASQQKPAAGAGVTGYLKIAGEPQSGVTVPRPAVIRADGKTWIYVQTADDAFRRKEIVLDRPLENGWFVASGVAAEDKVVIVGAPQLLSEELKSRGE